MDMKQADHCFDVLNEMSRVSDCATPELETKR